MWRWAQLSCNDFFFFFNLLALFIFIFYSLSLSLCVCGLKTEMDHFNKPMSFYNFLERNMLLSLDRIQRISKHKVTK